MTDDLAVLDDGASTLTVYRKPDVVLAEAREAAQALKAVIDAKPKKVQFNGETYLEFEDWQTVGRFYGIAPRIISTMFVEFGGVQGWEARCDAVHVPTGRIVASADAMCLNDEEKWRSRPKYAWAYVLKSGGHSVEDPGKDEIIWEDRRDGKGRAPKKEKVLAGEEHVPMFQLRSMAQTRAGSKALRNALAWVVVLAGYRPTPAEELPTGPSEAATTASGQSIDKTTGEVASTNGHEPAGTITEPQQKRLYAVARGSGWTEEQVHDYLTSLQIASAKDIAKGKPYDDIVNHLKTAPAAK
jgi:hypothetical protein